MLRPVKEQINTRANEYRWCQLEFPKLHSWRIGRFHHGETLALRVPAQKICITNKPQPIRLQRQGLFSRLENLATLEESVIVGRLYLKTKSCFKILSRKNKLCHMKTLECSSCPRKISQSKDRWNTPTPCGTGSRKSGYHTSLSPTCMNLSKDRKSVV